MKKKFISMILALSMAVQVGAFASATEADNSLDYELLSVEELSNGEEITIERMGDTILYTYKTESVIYCSQREPNGTMLFSFLPAGATYIYSSDIFNVSDISSQEPYTFSLFDNFSNLKQLNNYVICNIESFHATPAINLCQPMPLAGKPDPDPDKRAESTWGSDGIISTREKEHSGYTMYCTERQTTYKMDNAIFWFAEKTAISTIKTWFENLKNKPRKFDWFTTALQVTISTINGVKSIVDASEGSISFYECNRIKNATVPSVTDEIVYSSYWKSQKFFMFANNVWSQNDHHDSNRLDYFDLDQFFGTAFARFFANYL